MLGRARSGKCIHVQHFLYSTQLRMEFILDLLSLQYSGKAHTIQCKRATKQFYLPEFNIGRITVECKGRPLRGGNCQKGIASFTSRGLQLKRIGSHWTKLFFFFFLLFFLHSSPKGLQLKEKICSFGSEHFWQFI